MLKTFIFSVFIHILNSVVMTNDQIYLIQSMLNDFLWKGRSYVKQSVSCAPISDKSLNMIHVKNTVHLLHAKWMLHFCKDAGSSWSQYAWDNIMAHVPAELFCGLCSTSEKVLLKLPPFYSGML